MSILANITIMWLSDKENDFLLLLEVWAVELVFSRLVKLVIYFVSLIIFFFFGLRRHSESKASFSSPILGILQVWNSQDQRLSSPKTVQAEKLIKSTLAQ